MMDDGSLYNIDLCITFWLETSLSRATRSHNNLSAIKPAIYNLRHEDSLSVGNETFALAFFATLSPTSIRR